MCWKAIKESFIGWKPPYPEEKFNPDAHVENTDIGEAMFQWADDYNVPAEGYDYYITQLEIELDPDYQYPAGVWITAEGIRHMRVRPGYLNSGVIAHEQGHNAHKILTEDQKAWFIRDYTLIKDTDQIKKLWKYNSYGTSTFIEAHAEIYRYLGEYMPEVLKQYYPKLF